MILEALSGILRKKEEFPRQFFLEISETELTQVDGVAVVLMTEDNRVVVTTLPEEDELKSDIIGPGVGGFQTAFGLQKPMLSLVTGRLSDKPDSSSSEVAIAEIEEELGISLTEERLIPIERNSDISGFQVLGLQTVYYDPELWANFAFSEHSRKIIGIFASETMSEHELAEKVNTMLSSGELQIIKMSITDIFKAEITDGELHLIEERMSGDGRQILTFSPSELENFRQRVRPLTLQVLKNIGL